jgi:hypothetical protein
VAACLPSIVVLPFAKMVARNEHQSSMANFPGPSNCMEIFGDCVLKDMMWQSCVVARTKSSLTKKSIFLNLRFVVDHKYIKLKSSA